MTATDPTTTIHHDAAAHRFAASVDGTEAFVDYEQHGEQMVITHTRVPESIGGRGIAGQLTQAAFDHARSAGLTVRPQCSYAAAWVERHPDVSDLIA